MLATYPDVVDTSLAFPLLPCQREAFTLPAGVHFLNCAYMAPLSQAVERAGLEAMQRQRVPTAIAPAEYFAGPNRVRAEFARLVSSPTPDRVALVPSVSYAMAIATRNLPVAKGQRIVVIGDEFPSAVLPWRRLARERGATLCTVDAPTGPNRTMQWNARLYDAIDRQTAVVVLSHVHWSDGTVFDVATLAERAREVGAAVVVDGTQSVGAMPFDVSVVQPDLLVCAGYKWLMGGYGLSVAYFGPRFDDGLPLEEVWTSQLGSEDFSALATYRDAYRPAPVMDRYDGGQRASFVLAPMLCAAIQQLIAWHPERVQQYCAALFAPWWDMLASHGIVTNGEPDANGGIPGQAAHLVGLRFERPRDLRRLASTLRARNVHVSVRGDAIRVAPHVYNTPDDLAALVAVLTGGGTP